MIDNIKEFLFSDRGIKLGVVCLKRIYADLEYANELTRAMYPEDGDKEIYENRERYDFFTDNTVELIPQYLSTNNNSVAEMTVDGVLYAVRNLLKNPVGVRNKHIKEYFEKVESIYNENKKSSYK